MKSVERADTTFYFAKHRSDGKIDRTNVRSGGQKRRAEGGQVMTGHFKIVFSDIDGTLLDSQNRVPVKTREAILD